jgi:hypothetical protein
MIYPVVTPVGNLTIRSQVKLIIMSQVKLIIMSQVK